MAQQRPELFAAYVGTGQVSSWADTVQFQFDFLRQRYTEKGDTAALAALEAIGKPDPKNVKQYFGFSRPIRQHMNASDTAWLAGLKDTYSASGETEATLKAIGDGMSASGSALIEASVADGPSRHRDQLQDSLLRHPGAARSLYADAARRSVFQQGLGSEEAPDHHRRRRPLRAGHAPGRGDRSAEGSTPVSKGRHLALSLPCMPIIRGVIY